MRVLVAHNAELRHAIRERLGRWATPASSNTWAWVFVIAPFLLGVGAFLPVIVSLGLLWPLLRARERTVWVLLVASLWGFPYAVRALDRMALPMRDETTLAAVLPLVNEPFTPELSLAASRLSAGHPGDPFARFATGWMALSQADGAAAEAAYRDVLEAWPNDDRAYDNLGTALVLQGRQAEAIQAYQQAIASNPKNATAYFNLSQAFLAGFDFAAANRALTNASALDFDRIREYKNQPAHNGALNPVPDWIAPARQWNALRAAGSSVAPAMPPAWQGFPESSAPNIGWLALIAALLSVALSGVLTRGLPLYHCVNCDRVVCRRCAERRRAQNSLSVTR